MTRNIYCPVACSGRSTSTMIGTGATSGVGNGPAVMGAGAVDCGTAVAGAASACCVEGARRDGGGVPVR